MKCPNCSILMKEVYTKSDYGLIIKLDQCPSCGGIWFDKWELYKIPKKEVAKIDKVNKKLLHEIISTKKEIFCPKDKTKLEIFKDQNIPSNIQIERCKKCGGVWLNCGELIELKKSIKSKKQMTKFQKILSESLSESLKSSPSSTKFDSFSKIGSFLSAPLHSDSISTYEIQPIKIDKEISYSNEAMAKLIKSLPEEKRVEIYKEIDRGRKEDVENINKGIGTFLTILRTLLRLLAR